MDANGEKIASLLAELGLSRSMARSLACLSATGEAFSAQVERSAGLRQPEVSLAMRELRKQGWVHKDEVKRGGKGRPMHLYRLAIPFTDVVAALEEERRARVEREFDILAQLRALADARPPEARVNGA